MKRSLWKMGWLVAAALVVGCGPDAEMTDVGEALAEHDDASPWSEAAVDQGSFAAEVPCPRIDETKADVDGMPFCPYDPATTTAWTLMRCSSTRPELYGGLAAQHMSLLVELFTAFQTSRREGLSAATTQVIRSKAQALDLKVCRVKNEAASDSYLVLYTGPGSRYGGPLMMLRETRASNIVILSPHDGSDTTFAVTKEGLARTRALAVLANQHGTPHSAMLDNAQSLEFKAVTRFMDMFNKPITLHVHGKKHKKLFLYRARSTGPYTALGRTFEAAARRAFNVQRDDQFSSDFNAGYAIDSQMGAGYVKMELKASIMANRPRILAEIVKDIEKQPWAWADEAP